jgi:hypothetical protein
MASTVEILERARDRVAKGWCQGRFGDHERCCALGALRIGAGAVSPEDWPDDFEGESKARRLVRKVVFGTPGEAGLPHWNDTEGRTQQEVIAAFDAAIALAKKEEGANGHDRQV